MGFYRVFWRVPLAQQTSDPSGYNLVVRVSRVRGADFQDAMQRARHCFKIPETQIIGLEEVDVTGKRKAIAEALQARGEFLKGTRGFREDDLTYSTQTTQTTQKGWF